MHTINAPKTVCLVNGSPHGRSGNTSKLLERCRHALEQKVTVTELVLGRERDGGDRIATLSAADGYIFGTGTYWDSWGSPLQKLFEDLTEYEGSPLWLGKPVGVVVSMHAVGGKSVLSRLQGVLSSIGALVPPMSGIVCSLANQLAIQGSAEEATRDLWRPEDLEVVCHNVVAALSGTNDWRSWDLDSDNFRDVWVGEAVKK